MSGQSRSSRCNGNILVEADAVGDGIVILVGLRRICLTVRVSAPKEADAAS